MAAYRPLFTSTCLILRNIMKTAQDSYTITMKQIVYFRRGIFIYPVVCYRQTPWYHVYVLWVQNPPSSLPNSWSVTSIPQSVNRWRHNEYSWCSHPLHFVQASRTPVVKVRLVVWRSDLTGQGAGENAFWKNSTRIKFKMAAYRPLFTSTASYCGMSWKPLKIATPLL